jgi:hypothetical protein
MTAYDDFENPEQLRRFRKGTFTEFRAFLASESATNRPEVLDLAEAWRRHFTRAILANQFVLATLAVAITVGGIAVVAGVLLLLGLLADAELARGIEGAGELVEPSLANAMILSATILGALGITRFTTRYLGDVVAWATYEETDAKHRVRSAILSEGVAQLRHVLADPRCRRVVVVGHSLGTTVAYDALLGLGQRALARSGDRGVQEEIAKLDQFVTLASPVDTVHSMFESHVAKHHRYSRVFEGLRGDVGGPPFSRRRRPQVHWVNVWDRADIISGPLFSPNQKRASAMPVDNVEVRSLSFPDPASSHVAYFAHRDVITLIFRIVFDGAYSFRGENPSGQRVETPLPARRFLSWQLVMVAIPWLAAAYGVARITGANTWTSGILGWSALGLLVAAFVGFTYGRTRGHRAPL